MHFHFPKTFGVLVLAIAYMATIGLLVANGLGFTKFSLLETLLPFLLGFAFIALEVVAAVVVSALIFLVDPWDAEDEDDEEVK